MRFVIRNATPDDAGVVASYNCRMAEETEGRTLDQGVIGPGVAAVLGDPALGRYWVAESDGKVVGQLMVTFEWSDWRNGMIWWIQSVYVHPDHRRSGIFRALFRHVEALAKAEPGVCGLRLYHEQDNERARRTYESLGMVYPGYRVMETMFYGHRNSEPGDQSC